MVSPPSFKSWELTWNQYAQVVSQVAFELDPTATEIERTVRITASAASGLLDDSNIDPLAALLVGLVRNRSAADRLVAAQSLMQSGIDVERALSATGSRRDRSVTRSRERRAASDKTPTFEQIRSQAVALWEQGGPTISQLTQTPAELAKLVSYRASDRGPKLVEEHGAVAAAELGVRESEQCSQTRMTDRTRPRRRTAYRLLAFIVAGALAGRVMGPRLLQRYRHESSEPFLTVKDLPKQWALTFAASHQPAGVLNPTTVFQRFDSLDKTRTVLVTTLRQDRRFADASLGSPPVDRSSLASATMKFQAEATASDSFPVHTPADAPVMMEWKQPLVPFVMNQAETIVYVEAHGMASSDVRSLGRSLTARAKLLENGWSPPNGFSEQIVAPAREVLEGIQSSLIFTSNVDGNTRVVAHLRRAGGPTIDISDLYPRESVTLPSGRVVTFSREFVHNYRWDESGYEINVTVLRSSNEVLGDPGMTQQTAGPYSRLEPLPYKHLDGILDLLDRMRLGTEEQWRSLTERYQAFLNSLPSLEFMNIGGNEIERRRIDMHPKEKGSMRTEPVLLCASSICAPIYRSSDGTAKEADLLIDDHWWHFRQIPKTDETGPKYFTSPAVDSFKTGEAKFDQTHKWWGIDFGRKVTAARNADEATPLLRPLPR
jgi:hypothetical protein